MAVSDIARPGRRLRGLVWVAIAAMLAVMVIGTSGGSVSAVSATTSLHQTPPIAYNNAGFLGDEEECAGENLSAGQVLWHFVLVQTAYNDGLLHATFADGTVRDNVSQSASPGPTLHWEVITGQTSLTGAHTNRTGARLVLSHICVGPPVTTTTTTTTATTTTTVN